MEGSSGKAAAGEAYNINRQLSGTMYDLSSGALRGGMDYTRSLYEKGGMDQSAKYTAQRGSFLDASAGRTGSFLNPSGMGQAAAARATGLSSIGGAQILSGVDEMNKLRSQLAGQGIQTTNFSQQAGEQATRAIGGMAWDPTMSAIGMGLGAASAIYKTGANAGAWGQGQNWGSGFTPGQQATYGGGYGQTMVGPWMPSSGFASWTGGGQG